MKEPSPCWFASTFASDNFKTKVELFVELFVIGCVPPVPFEQVVSMHYTRFRHEAALRSNPNVHVLRTVNSDRGLDFGVVLTAYCVVAE